MRKLLLVYILFVFSCSKDDDVAVGPLTLEFDNRLEDHPGATITYYITDIKLEREDGVIFHDGQTHHVDASDEGSQEITLENISTGGARFTIEIPCETSYIKV